MNANPDFDPLGEQLSVFCYLDMNETASNDAEETTPFASAVDSKTDDLQNREDNNVQIKIEPEDTYPEETHIRENDTVLTAINSVASNVRRSPTLSSTFSDDSNDVSPNFSEAVYTSTPLIESLINGKFPAGDEFQEKPVQKPNTLKRKSAKQYRINDDGDGPKYICNVCEYGTYIYKTIHNHMYRHESQKYQCPYCGYRRSPKYEFFLSLCVSFFLFSLSFTMSQENYS